MSSQNTSQTLEQWLSYIQAQHSKSIDMSLERARAVATRLALAKPAPLVITVAGTNGKGSTVAFLQALLMRLGLRTGCYTSPHILHFEERIFLSDALGRGRWVSENELVVAFTRIEAARGELTLTYFEYATLAAWLIFFDAALDAVVLEVGLGGRLDAVNLIDADAVILTTVDLDHQDYLGNTRALIGAEKAGVFRVLQTAIYADREPVPEVIRMAERIGTELLRPKRDYFFREHGEGWRFQFRDQAELILPLPNLAAPCQLDNAAACIALMIALKAKLPAFNIDHIAAAICAAHIPGRLSLVGQAPAIYLDVAHNPQAAESLARWLHANPIFGRNCAVYGGMQDKDVLGVVSALKEQVQQWYLCGLEQETARGLDAMALTARVRGATRGEYDSFADTATALDAAIKAAKSTDRILVFGSFFLIAAAYRALGVTHIEPFSLVLAVKDHI